MIKNLEPRLYQETILATCAEKNCLVVLPTGMGKSIVFIMLAAQRLNSFPNSKILILAPTKPLCEQHFNSLNKFLEVEEICLLTGSIKPEERKLLFEKSKIIVSTPQGLENDIIAKRIFFEDISLLVFDECHRAVKDYSYTWLAKHYVENANFPRILGLSASPGGDLEKIKEVCENLSIEDIEVRTESDPDMKPYIQDVKINYVEVELSEEFKKIRKYIIDFIDNRGEKLKLFNVITKKASSMNKIDFIKLQGGLQKQISEGFRDFDTLKAVSVLAEIMKMHYALELLETQGLTALKKYFDKLFDDSIKTKTKAVKNLVTDINYKSARVLVDNLIEKEQEHPKLGKLKDLLSELIKDGEKAIVFNNYRDNAQNIVNEVNKISGIKAELFVGQAKRNGIGLSQKQQIGMLERFRNNEFNVIVMTSVGEEGLDIPKVDYVVFYEPVSSAIRHVQRKGRTGRLEKGEVHILITKGTRDEIYRWSSVRKESKMHTLLRSLKGNLNLNKTQKNISDFEKSEDVLIYADHREKSSRILKELLNRKVTLELKQLEVADYILSEDVGVEYKTKTDFVDSILDGRLIGQLKDLKYNFKRPILILEGDEDLFSLRNIHPNAIRGMLATISVSYGIPIINTRTAGDTAEMLITIAKREQEKGEKYFTPHVSKRTSSLKDEQLYFVSALPNIGLKLAKGLLEEFKTPVKIVNASLDELKKVEKIGEEKAKKLREVFDKEE